MFDTHISTSEVVAVTRVVEKSITPDKVTEMYDKTRAEVERDIIQKVLISDGSLEGVVIVMHEMSANRTHRIVTGFKLNGHFYEDTTLETFAEDALLSSEEMLSRFVRHYSNVVGMLLSRKCFIQTQLKSRK